MSEMKQQSQKEKRKAILTVKKMEKESMMSEIKWQSCFAIAKGNQRQSDWARQAKNKPRKDWQIWRENNEILFLRKHTNKT